MRLWCCQRRPTLAEKERKDVQTHDLRAWGSVRSATTHLESETRSTTQTRTHAETQDSKATTLKCRMGGKGVMMMMTWLERQRTRLTKSRDYNVLTIWRKPSECG